MPRSRLAWAYLLGVILIWLLGAWVGERTVYTLLLAYTPPLLWLLPAPLVLAWCLWRRRRLGPVLLGALLAAGGAGLFHWNFQRGGELRVLTYNVRSGTQTTPARLAGAISAANADLVLLQEANFARPEFHAQLVSLLPGYSVTRAAEVTTLSRLPLQDVQRYDLPLNRREVLLTRVSWQGEPLNVVNAHLGTVMLSSLLSGDLERVRHTRNARAAQVRVLLDIAARAQGPLLLGGDLNTPPRGLVYRQLRAAYGPDAHDRAGRGPGWTFPSLKLRIDHQMSRELRAVRTRVLPDAGSDHLPLLVEYR